MSSTCFQVNWSTCEVPKVVAFSRSCLESAPSGSSLRKKTLGSEVMTWKCLASGRKLSITSTERLCAHHATLPAVVAKPGPIAASHGRSRWLESGSQAPSPAIQALPRSEEYTSELQSHSDLVCRLPLEK